MENNEIKEAILSALGKETRVEIKNPRGDGLHFEATVGAKCFAEKSKLKQHRLVMDALKEHFDSSRLHAMSLETYALETYPTKQ